MLVFYGICILCKQMVNASREKLCLKPMGLKLGAASKVTGKMDWAKLFCTIFFTCEITLSTSALVNGNHCLLPAICKRYCVTVMVMGMDCPHNLSLYMYSTWNTKVNYAVKFVDYVNRFMLNCNICMTSVVCIALVFYV